MSTPDPLRRRRAPPHGPPQGRPPWARQPRDCDVDLCLRL